MAASLEQLLVERTKDDEYDALRSVLQAKGFPVSDYLPGSAAAVILEAWAFALSDLSKLLPQVARGGFATLAKELADPGWLDLVGEHIYNLPRARATFTKQRCRVSCGAGFGPQVVNPGFVIQANTKDGNRYIYQGASPVTVPDHDSENIEFTAEFSGSSYANGAGTLTQLVTPLPGLSVNNPNRTFGGTDSAGAARRNSLNRSSGTITPSGSPVLSRFYTITVLTSGQQPSTGSLRITYQQDGVDTSVTVAPIPATHSLSDGVILTISNGVGAGFVAGDLHTFQTPGTAITAAGTDDESQEAYYRRLVGRWPSLSLNVVGDKYVAWVRQCSIDHDLGIEKITVRPSSTVAGQADILVATALGGPDPGSVLTLQQYINARDGIVDAGEVAGATNEPLALGGTIYCEADKVASAQAAADENWRSYVQDLPIGGDTSTGVPGVVRFAELVQALMDADGVVDHAGLLLEGLAANSPLAANEVAVVADLPSGLTWVTV